MRGNYEGAGIHILDIIPVISLVVAVLAVLAAAYFYADSRRNRTSTDFAIARAATRAAQLEGQLRSLETQMNDTRASVQQAVNATASAAVAQAVTQEVNKAIAADPSIGRTNQEQTWTKPQTFASEGTANSVTIGDATVQWKLADSVRNRISAGTVNFGDEVIMGAPNAWDPLGGMLQVASDLTPAIPGNTPVVSVRDHWNGQGILFLGMDGAGAPAGRPYLGDWRVGLYTDKLLFGPPGYRDAVALQTGISRGADGQLFLLSNGNRYVEVREEYTSIWNPVLNNIKDTPGEPTSGVVEGFIYINTADNAVKIFADGDWRTLSSW